MAANHTESALLHDGKLVGLIYEPGDVIRLKLVTDLGLPIDIVLRGVLRFVANNLLEGNIVFDVHSTKFGNIDMSSAREIVRDAFPHEFLTPPPTRVPRSNPQWEKWLDQVKEGILHLFVLHASYGATVIALCADVDYMDMK